MGEYAEMMLDGTCCQYCGEYLGSDNDYPTSCRSCAKEDEPRKEFLKEKDVNNIAQKICDDMLRKLGAIGFDTDLKFAFHQNIKGILSNFYKDEKGHIRNEGYEKTIRNNQAAKLKKKK